MRQKKIRGHNRIHKQIEKWRVANLQLNQKRLVINGDCYVKIIVHPFCDLTFINSKIPQPRRKTKTLILSALLDIYDSWKAQLDTTGQPYDLKIWLYENNFSKSQVVCAVNNMIGFYDNTFNKAQTQKPFYTSAYGQLKERLEKYYWEQYNEENFYTNDEVGDQENYKSFDEFNDHKKWFERLLKKKHKTVQLTEKAGNAFECYLFYRGKVWIGEKRKPN